MGVSSLGIRDGIASGQDFVEKFKDSGPLLNTKLFLRVHLGVR